MIPMNKFMSNANITLKEIIKPLYFQGILRSFKVISNLLNDENIYFIKQVCLNNSTKQCYNKTTSKHLAKTYKYKCKNERDVPITSDILCTIFFKFVAIFIK